MSATASTNTVYNDGNIQYGSIIATIMQPPQPTGTTRGIFILENCSVKRPVKVIERPDEIGGPNGFVGVAGQVDASCVIQMSDPTVSRPQNGDWFTYTFDAIIGAERFVILGTDDPREMQGYFKCNATLKKATFPATTPTFVPA